MSKISKIMIVMMVGETNFRFGSMFLAILAEINISINIRSLVITNSITMALLHDKSKIKPDNIRIKIHAR